MPNNDINNLLIGFLEKSSDKTQPKGVTGLETGFSELDYITCGLQKGDLCIIAGRTSIGKTALAMNMAARMAFHNQKRVAFFNLEMTDIAFVMRLLSAQSRVPLNDLQRHIVGDRDWNRVLQTADKFTENLSNLNVCHDTDITPNTIGNAVVKAQNEDNRSIDCIFIDYVQLMRADEQRENAHFESVEIAHSLKRMAKNLNCPIVAISQLSRRAVDQSRGGRPPILSDLYGAGAFEQDADLVLFLHSEDTRNIKGITLFPVELIVAKQRNGQTGSVNLVYVSSLTRFENYITT